MQNLERDIRAEVARYTSRQISLDHFMDWFVPHALWLDEHANEFPNLADLSSEIDLRLIEYDQGLWTEEELVELLEQFATPVPRYAEA